MDNEIRNHIGGGKSLGKIIIISAAGNFEDEYFKMPDGSMKILRLELKPTKSVGDGLLNQLRERLQFALDEEDYEAAKQFTNQIKLLEDDKNKKSNVRKHAN